MGQRIIIYYATLGTGHKSAAMALQGWFQKVYPGIEVRCQDVLDYVPSWMGRLIVNFYLFMARYTPVIWGKLYQNTDKVLSNLSFWNVLHKAVCKVYLPHLLHDLYEYNPQGILATHFFAMVPLVQATQYKTPVYYVNTDFISHALQRCPCFSAWYVGCEKAIYQYTVDGIKENIRAFGIPVAPIYSSPPTKKKSLWTLKLNPALPVVLLLGGGIGVGPLEVIADSFIDLPEIQLLVICGNNHKMYGKLKEKYHPFRERIHVMGFVDCMPEYYVASDLVILKPGGLCSAEALAIGVPMLLMTSLPGQEQYNADYLLEQGVALRLYEDRAAGIYVQDLLKNEDTLQGLKQRSAEWRRIYAGRDIVCDVVKRINEK